MLLLKGIPVITHILIFLISWKTLYHVFERNSSSRERIELIGYDRDEVVTYFQNVLETPGLCIFKRCLFTYQEILYGEIKQCVHITHT